MKSSAMTFAISFHLFFVHALQRTTETMKANCNVGRIIIVSFVLTFSIHIPTNFYTLAFDLSSIWIVHSVL